MGFAYCCEQQSAICTFKMAHMFVAALVSPFCQFGALSSHLSLQLTITAAQATFVWTPFGPAKSLDTNHQWTIALAAILAAFAMFSVLISTIVLRNAFQKVVKAIPALDPSLLTTMGGGFSAFYAVSAMGGVVLAACLALIAEDAR